MHSRSALTVALVVGALLGLATAGPAQAQDCFLMDTSGQTTLSQGGIVCLAFNDVCGSYGSNSGSFSVTLTLERASVVVEGPDAFTVNGDDAPCLSTFGGGSGSNTTQTCTTWNAQAGDVLMWTASGSIDRGGGLTGPAGDNGNATNTTYLCTDPGNAFGLIGSVGTWPENHNLGFCAPVTCGTPECSGDGDCTANPLLPSCESGMCAVPTLSEWGIAALALLMLGGVLRRRRRHRATHPG